MHFLCMTETAQSKLGRQTQQQTPQNSGAASLALYGHTNTRAYRKTQIIYKQARNAPYKSGKCNAVTQLYCCAAQLQYTITWNQSDVELTCSNNFSFTIDEDLCGRNVLLALKLLLHVSSTSLQFFVYRSMRLCDITLLLDWSTVRESRKDTCHWTRVQCPRHAYLFIGHTTPNTTYSHYTQCMNCHNEYVWVNCHSEYGWIVIVMDMGGLTQLRQIKRPTAAELDVTCEG